MKVKVYKKGEKPLVGDVIEHIEEDEDYENLDTVSSINNDGTINVRNAIGILYELEPSDFYLVSRRTDAIELECQVKLNGMSYKEFNVRFSKFLKENKLEIV